MKKYWLLVKIDLYASLSNMENNMVKIQFKLHCVYSNIKLNYATAQPTYSILHRHWNYIYDIGLV